MASLIRPPFGYTLLVPLGLAVLICLSGNCGQNNRRISFLTPAMGFYLEGHVFSNHSVKLNLDCQHQCSLARECVSYNIGPMINNKMACELSNSDHLQHPEDLKPRKDWFYRGTEVWLNNTTNQCQLLNPTLRLRYHHVVKICFNLILKPVCIKSLSLLEMHAI